MPWRSADDPRTQLGELSQSGKLGRTEACRSLEVAPARWASSATSSPAPTSEARPYKYSHDLPLERMSRSRSLGIYESGGRRSMGRPRMLLLLFSFLLPSAAAAVDAATKSYVVYLGGHSHGPDATAADYQRATDGHYALLESCLGRGKARESIIYSYAKIINGFAARLDEEQAKKIAGRPGVISVFPNTRRELHTTKSWEFLGVVRNGSTVPPRSIWRRARYGEDTIIANIDTGVWPESESFNDHGLGPVPSRWKGHCEEVANPKHRVPCNRKLIGARHFSESRSPDDKFDSARDFDGHGSHTLSTAAGRPVPGANVFGIANGTATGGSPSARVACYKACTSYGCYDADILAAFDAAIADGVDVISISLGGMADDYFNNSVDIGSFHAVAHGIPVMCSGGNNGPSPQSVTNVAPWIFTVAAGSTGRKLVSPVSLGNRRHTEGWSLSSKHLPAGKFYPLIDAGEAKTGQVLIDEARLCYPDSLDREKVKGKIVVCLRGDISRMLKAFEVSKAGGAGMIVVNTIDYGDDVTPELFMIPAAHLTYAAAASIFSYLNSTKSPVAHIGKPEAHYGLKPAPLVAEFSSRGPNFLSPQILKPDILAPGVDILAAYSQGIPASFYTFDTRRVAFNVFSGTSMACPHISGVVGLLRTMYPQWSPAALRSAIMTTARSRDNTGSGMKDSSLAKATPFDYGAGQVQPDRAADPGLVYDLTVDDHLRLLCALGYNSTQVGQLAGKPFACPPKHVDPRDFNYPSITVFGLSAAAAATVTRRVKNVGAPGTYRVRVKPPRDVAVSVDPTVLKFDRAGEEKTFRLSLAKRGRAATGYAFGQLVWSDGRHGVRSPLVVRLV